jgi:hypothetical protein
MSLPADAPPALTQVAQRFEATSRGVVGFRMHRTFDVHAGFQRRHEELTMEGIYDDGKVAKVRISTYTIDGKDASAADRSTVELAWEHPQPGNVFAPPFDADNFTSYEYRSAGAQDIAFTSDVKDQAHGSGTFSYDADGDVVTYEYHPNVLPPHASSGDVTVQRAQVLPGYWAVTQEIQHYSGTYAIFHGSGTVTMNYSDFRRFADLPSALRSI